jgi:hypothetical protein
LNASRLVCAVLWIALVTTAAHAQAPATCPGGTIEPAPKSEYTLAPLRSSENWLSIGYVGDTGASAFALGYELVPILSQNQKRRLGFHLDALFGHVGDDKTAVFATDFSLRYHQNVFMDDFTDVSLLFKGGVGMVFDPTAVLSRPGAGLSLRVLRAVSVEATADGLFALESKFADGKRAHLGMTVALAVDLCAVLGDCEPSEPPKPEPRRLNCELYAMANQMCARSPRHDALCRAVNEGLGDRASQAASARFDDMDALLNAIRAHVQEPGLAAAFEQLQQAHRANLDAFSKAQAAERNAATQDRRCAEHITYAPVASELRAALGCGASSTCQVVCAPDPPKE